MNANQVAVIVCTAMLLASGAASAQEPGARGMEFYLEHCKSCHGSDAAAFAGQSLQIANGVVTTKDGRGLAEFLTRHGAADARDRAELLAIFESMLRRSR